MKPLINNDIVPFAVHLKSSSNNPFDAFMIQVREEGEDIAVGSFTVTDDANTVLSSCLPPEVIHNNHYS